MKDKIIVNKNYPVPKGYKTIKVEGNIRYLEVKNG